VLPGVRSGGRGIDAIVVIELSFLLRRDLVFGVERRSVADLRLLYADPEARTLKRCSRHRHEGRLAAQQPTIDERELGLIGAMVEVDVTNLTNLTTFWIDELLSA
jgi:hypothetical protein